MTRPQAIPSSGIALPFGANAAVRSAMSEMECSRGQRVLGAPSRAGGWMSDGSRTASLEMETGFNTALSP